MLAIVRKKLFTKELKYRIFLQRDLRRNGFLTLFKIIKKCQRTFESLGLHIESEVTHGLRSGRMEMNPQRPNAHLSEKHLVTLKDILLAQKENILNKMEAEDSFELDRNELFDPVDEAAINVQAEHTARFRSREGFLVRKIAKALNDMTRGEYGLCKECDASIPFERLQARPVADMCINCKEDSEQTEKSKLYKKVSKSLGKTAQEYGRK